MCAFARSLQAVRIVLLGIGLSTVMLLLITLPHLGELTPFPFWWMLFYIVDPLLVGFTFWRLGWRTEEASARNPFRSVWFGHAAILLAAGLLLLVFPRTAVDIWPWSLTEPLAQFYSAFFLTLAIASVLAARESESEGTRLPMVMILVLALLVLAVSFYHLERFKPGVSTVLWFTFFGQKRWCLEQF